MVTPQLELKNKKDYNLNMTRATELLLPRPIPRRRSLDELIDKVIEATRNPNDQELAMEALAAKNNAFSHQQDPRDVDLIVQAADKYATIYL